MCVGKVTSAAKMQGPFGPKKSATKRLKILSETGKMQYQDDILAVSTYYTKIILFAFGDFFQGFQDSIGYKILFHTTQPAHLITALSVIAVSCLMYPNDHKTSLQSPIWTLLYLGAFSAHFGAQIWMTFVSGLALYFALPRHTFGNIQQVLFPKYFLINSVLSLITLAVFVRGHNADFSLPNVGLQTGAMTVCFLTELVIRLYLTPPLLTLMTIKNGMEREAGVGMEVGKLVAGNLLKCPHYVKIHKAFRRVHMTIAMGNIVAMSCTMFHLYYLSHKLCVF